MLLATCAHAIAATVSQTLVNSGLPDQVRLLGYDHLKRHNATTDSVGAVESFTYTPNDQIETHTDANGHRTINHYDGLHRRDRQDLPSEPGQPRAIVYQFRPRMRRHVPVLLNWGVSEEWKRIGLPATSYWSMRMRRLQTFRATEGVFSLPSPKSKKYAQTKDEMIRLVEVGLLQMAIG